MNDLKTTDRTITLTEHTPSGTFYSVHNYQKYYQQNNHNLINKASHNQTAIPIIFIHGVGLNHLVWQPQVEYFKQKYCVVSYDLLGHGNSSLPKENVTLLDYAKQLDELLTHLKISAAHIVGHSMGALIAVCYLINFPSRVVSSIPLNIVYKRTESQRDAVLQRASDVLKSNKITGINTALKRWFKSSDDPHYIKKVADVRGWLEQADPIGYRRTYRLFAKSDEEFSGRLHEVQTPILFITGDKDLNSTPLMSQQMADDTAAGEYRVLKNEAHMLAYISPEIVNPLIKCFIKKSELKEHI